MKGLILGTIYLSFIFLGWLILIPSTQKTKKFVLHEYLLMLVPPFFVLTYLILSVGMTPLIVYIVGLILGPIMEWLFGFFYHKINGARLWVYERLSLPGKYTSFLSAPLWGFFFVGVWLIVQYL